VGARLHQRLGVPLLFTAHSLGREKRRRLLSSGLDPSAIEARYALSRRIEAEEFALPGCPGGDQHPSGTRGAVRPLLPLPAGVGPGDSAWGRFPLLPPSPARCAGAGPRLRTAGAAPGSSPGVPAAAPPGDLPSGTDVRTFPPCWRPSAVPPPSIATTIWCW
jgi:hypothetical protein